MEKYKIPNSKDSNVNYEQGSVFSTTKGIVLFATLSCILWGSAFPALKYSYGVLGLTNVHFSYDLQFAGYRFFLSSIVVLAVILFKKLDIRIPVSYIPKILILGLLQTTILYFFFYVGLSNTSGVKSSIISSTGTFFGVVLPHFIYKDDKMSLIKALGLTIGLLGVIIISTTKGSIDSGFKFTGEGYLIISSLVSAFANIYGKELTKRINPVVMNFYALFSGSLIMIVISFLFTGKNVIHMTMSFAPMMIYLAFIPGAAFTLWYLMLEVNKVSRVVVHKFQIPIWGSILSSLLIKGEAMTPISIISLILVCAGIVIVSIYSNNTSKSRSIGPL
jgi:drug/metabolite transporter (DMT)-like permease